MEKVYQAGSFRVETKVEYNHQTLRNQIEVSIRENSYKYIVYNENVAVDMFNRSRLITALTGISTFRGKPIERTEAAQVAQEIYNDLPTLIATASKAPVMSFSSMLNVIKTTLVGEEITRKKRVYTAFKKDELKSLLEQHQISYKEFLKWLQVNNLIYSNATRTDLKISDGSYIVAIR